MRICSLNNEKILIWVWGKRTGKRELLGILKCKDIFLHFVDKETEAERGQSACQGEQP